MTMNDNDNEIDLFRHHNRNNTNTKVIFFFMYRRSYEVIRRFSNKSLKLKLIHNIQVQCQTYCNK